MTPFKRRPPVTLRDLKQSSVPEISGEDIVVKLRAELDTIDAVRRRTGNKHHASTRRAEIITALEAKGAA